MPKIPAPPKGMRLVGYRPRPHARGEEIKLVGDFEPIRAAPPPADKPRRISRGVQGSLL
jgi:hypothetical protein